MTLWDQTALADGGEAVLSRSPRRLQQLEAADPEVERGGLLGLGSDRAPEPELEIGGEPGAELGCASQGLEKDPGHAGDGRYMLQLVGSREETGQPEEREQALQAGNWGECQR